MPATILLVPTGQAARDVLTPPLTLNGYRVVLRQHQDPVEAIRLSSPDLVILQQSVAQGALAVAEAIRHRGFRMPILCLSRAPEGAVMRPESRLESINFLPPPHRPELVVARVGECLDRCTAALPGWPASVKPLVGESAHVRHLRSYLPQVAAADCGVLITGETGTGKELVAESIHRLGPRRDSPWVALNCAALPESLLESELFGFERGSFTGATQSRAGKFELAQNGSIFLDEIGELPLSGQAKLLRVIEAREVARIGGRQAVPVRARLIAATNQEADRLIKEGLFRADLFYRLNVVRIHVPPLRERPEDVPPLLDHLACGTRQAEPMLPYGFAADAIGLLCRYAWPGNVREMRNLVESLAVLRPTRPVSAVGLPEHIRREPAGKRSAAEDTRAQLASALAAANWNKSEAARRLHWSRMTVYRKLHEFNLHK